MDYVAVLALPAEQKTWRAGDVPALTAACLYPLPMGPDPVVTVLLRIDKVRGKDVQKPLSSADRVELQACWHKCGLAPPPEPMSSDQWVPYLKAFNLNQDGGAKRKRWVFAVQPPDDPQRVVGIAQAISETNHTKRLKQAIESREVTVRLPDMTEAPEGLNLNRVYLTWSEVVKFGALLCIQVIDVAVQKDAYTVGWYDETMEASHWFSIRDLDPLRAAMLLCRYNPNQVSLDDAALRSNPEITPQHFNRLRQKLEDHSKTMPKVRGLREWMLFAEKESIRIHTWVRQYLDARRKSSNASRGRKEGQALRCPVFERLAPSRPFSGGYLADIDDYTLAKASEMASKHAGQSIGEDDFIRAAARGQITMLARCPRDAEMYPVNGVGEPVRLYENDWTRLPFVAARDLQTAGHAVWRSLEEAEPVPESSLFPARLGFFDKWVLDDDEPPFEAIAEDCRVTGYWLHALADAFGKGPDFAPAEAGTATAAPEALTRGPDTKPEHACPDSDDDWKEQARVVARRIRAEGVKRGWFLNLLKLGNEVADDFNKRGIVGPNGHAMSGAQIKRNALQGHGITKPADKLRSAPQIPRGK